MIVRRLSPLSLAKVSGIIYAILGLITGVTFALVSRGASNRESGGAFVDLMFGVGALVIMPLGYGLVGFVFSLIMAAL